MKHIDALDAAVGIPTSEQSVQFRVRLTLATQPIFYDALTLDGLLAYTVVQRATEGRGYPESGEPYWIPLPLNLWWQAENGLPLWAATRFYPETPDDAHSVYWHKREFTPTFLKRARDGRPANVNFGNGVYKSYRIPMPAHTSLAWTAYGEGDVNEVASLLSTVTHVGKKRTYGYGAVVNCEVEAIEQAMPIAFENKLLKSMPLTFVAEHPDIFDGAADLEKQVRFCGWTPPYWHGACMEACWT